MTLNFNYIFLTAVIPFLLIFSFNSILFLLTICFSGLFGIFLFLESVSKNAAKDYDIFDRKLDDPIRFIDCDHHAKRYFSHSIQNKVKLVPRLELNNKFSHDYEIDKQLNDIVRLITSNHVNSWFKSISPNHEFHSKIYLFLNYTVTSVIERLKNVDLADLITSKFVDGIIKHKRLYRMTKAKLEYKIHTKEEFIQMFFNIERKSEKTFSHEKICLDQKALIQYLSRICDILQYSLIPLDSFRDETFKIITKQLFIKIILLPMFETFSEPDFINRMIIGFLKSNNPTTETFINVLQSTHDMNELKAVLESLENEILLVRSKDYDADESRMRQQLHSLLYLKNILISLLEKFEDEITSNDNCNGGNDTDSTVKDKLSISFDTILRHNIALEYFIEYMSTVNADNYINFYINVQTFKISVEQGFFEVYLSSMNEPVTTEQYHQLQIVIHDTAINIYETYLAPDSFSQLKMVDQNSCQLLYKNLMSEDCTVWMNDNLFDEIFFQVREIILNHTDFFPSFKKSKYYRKLLNEPDLLRDSLDDDLEMDGYKSENGNKVEKKNSKLPTLDNFDIDIIDTGILNLQGKAFIGYLINIKRKNGENWTILRRYSEFFNFHQLILTKCEKSHLNLKSVLFLPPKTVLSNRMNENFVQNRRYMLNLYLKKLNYLYEKFLFIREDIEKFLQPGNYDLNVSKNLMLNPIKTIGNVFKNQSENLMDSFQKLSRTFSVQTDLNKTNQIAESFQTTSLGGKSLMFDIRNNSNSSSDFSIDWMNNDPGIDHGNSELIDSVNESEENFPLLLLLDEVFDLKSQNFWLRRRFIELFKQIVEVAYSDTINKKMVDSINEWTKPSSISEYLDLFKNVFWPDGKTGKSTPRKQENCLRRKVATKALILTYLSDLKRVVGNETLQTGLTTFFELFQDKILNLRLMFVLFEMILKELFPDSYFDEIFSRLYMAFDDKSFIDETKNNWPPHLTKFISKN